jgi:hypothetical protein
MTVPSQMSLRRIPDALHLKARMVYAAGWEALIDTHTTQALQFICEFAPRLPALDGLDLYFRVTAVPQEMQETVRVRTLTALDLESLAPLAPLPVLSGWQRLRIDLVLEQQRYRRRYYDKTLELARMVGARAAEAVIATHVENALEFIQLLSGVLPVHAATDRYLREFGLSDSVAQMVLQRVQARVAGQELTAQYNEPSAPAPDPVGRHASPEAGGPASPPALPTPVSSSLSSSPAASATSGSAPERASHPGAVVRSR